MSCELCPKTAMRTPHHIYTRGAHGKAAMVPENEIPLCFGHHTQAHSLGRDTFAARYRLEERVRIAEEAVRNKVHRVVPEYTNSDLSARQR